MTMANGKSMKLNDTLNPLLLAYVADTTQSNYFILIPFKKGTLFILVQPVVSDNMQAKEAKLYSLLAPSIQAGLSDYHTGASLYALTSVAKQSLSL